MKSQSRFKLVTLFLLVFLFSIAGISAIGTATTPTRDKPTQTTAQEHLVTYVVDGDTVVVDGKTTVRLIGIDTPERGEPGYEQATEHLESLIGNRFVRIEKGIEQTDRYGRELGYIYIGQRSINQEMIAAGQARTLPIEPNTRYADIFYKEERKAKQARLGLWSIDTR